MPVSSPLLLAVLLVVYLPPAALLAWHDGTSHRLPNRWVAGLTGGVGLALAVLSADCVPVLLSDDDAGVIAGVHAGRVGARIGIVPATLRAMVELGARIGSIGAFLGPAASGDHYEVPADMQADVEKHLPGSAVRTKKGTAGLDLRAGLRRQLLEAGVAGVAVDPRDTIADPSLFSHRRGAPTGRLASVIWMDPDGDAHGDDAHGDDAPGERRPLGE